MVKEPAVAETAQYTVDPFVNVMSEALWSVMEITPLAAPPVQVRGSPLARDTPVVRLAWVGLVKVSAPGMLMVALNAPISAPPPPLMVNVPGFKNAPVLLSVTSVLPGWIVSTRELAGPAIVTVFPASALIMLVIGMLFFGFKLSYTTQVPNG